MREKLQHTILIILIILIILCASTTHIEHVGSKRIGSFLIISLIRTKSQYKFLHISVLVVINLTNGTNKSLSTHA